MATTRKEKEAALTQVTEDLKNARGVVFAEYRGMTVKQVDNVRKALRKENVKYKVVKITLLKKALASLGINTDKLTYKGPLAVAMSTQEETSPARILKSLIKDNPQIVFDGGVYNNEFIDVEMVNKLASIPGREQLLTNLVYVLTGNVRSLLYALNAIKEKKA